MKQQVPKRICEKCKRREGNQPDLMGNHWEVELKIYNSRLLCQWCREAMGEEEDGYELLEEGDDK